MSSTKKRPLVLILVLVVLIAVRLAMEQTVRQSIHQFGIEHGFLAQPLPIAQVPQAENWTPPKTPTRAEYVSIAYSSLESQHGTANWSIGTGARGGWLHSAYVVGLYGDPDKATESIIDLIQNRGDATAEDLPWSENYSSESYITRTVNRHIGDSYRVRISVLAPLGLTGTERAEEFLFNAYKNPGMVVAHEKYGIFLEKSHESIRREGKIDTSHLTPANLELSLSLAVLKPALLGLLYLNEEKYSSVLEAECDKLLSNTQIDWIDRDTMFEAEYYRLFPKGLSLESKNAVGEFRFMDRYLSDRLEILRDILDSRDTIREVGVEQAILKMYNEMRRQYLQSCH